MPLLALPVVCSPTGPAHALAWVDLLPYLLGNFSSVKEAVAWVMSPVVQVTTDLPPAPFEVCAPCKLVSGEVAGLLQRAWVGGNAGVTGADLTGVQA